MKKKEQSHQIVLILITIMTSLYWPFVDNDLFYGIINAMLTFL